MLGDPLFWIFVLPGLLLGMYAQGRIKANIAKYSQVGTPGGITGAQVARALLDSQGLQGVAIESTPGMLSDHYDPHSKLLRLSQQVYFAPTVAAAGIAAHEAGHACRMRKTISPWRRAPTLYRAARFADCALGVCRRYHAATLDRSVDRCRALRSIFAFCSDHFASRIQCQCEGAAIVGQPSHHPGRCTDWRSS
jgi:hypothetical protein